MRGLGRIVDLMIEFLGFLDFSVFRTAGCSAAVFVHKPNQDCTIWRRTTPITIYRYLEHIFFSLSPPPQLRPLPALPAGGGPPPPKGHLRPGERPLRVPQAEAAQAAQGGVRRRKR